MNFRSCLTVLLVVVVLVVGFVIARYVLDVNAYNSAHQAYTSADCASAIPSYEKVANAFHIMDVDNYRARAARELAECQKYQSGVEQEGSGNLPDALTTYRELVSKNGKSALVKPAQARMLAMLSGDPRKLVSDSTCGSLTPILTAAGFESTARVAAMPGLYNACGAHYQDKAMEQESFTMYMALVSEYPSDPLAQSALEGLKNSSYLCEQIAQDKLPDDLKTNNVLFPDAYLTCGQALADKQQNKEAAALFQAFLDQYPDDARAEEAKKMLALALIADAKASGAGTIDTPNKVSGNSSGTTIVTIQNDSPARLRLVFTGPVTRIEELESCPSCQRYSGMGPAFCPEKGPIGKYEMPSGEYDVLVETISDTVTPYTGDWKLEGGNYYSCFFIVTTTY